jgi:hypothetical protein
MTNTGDTMDKKDKGQTPVFVLCLFCPLYGLCLSFVFFVHCIASVCPLSFLSIVLSVFVLCLFCPLYRLCLSLVFFVHNIQCAKKAKEKHRPQNGQKKQKTNTDNTMDKKDKRQKGGDTMYKKDKG